MSAHLFFSNQKEYRELRKKNVAVMFRTTALSMIVNELTGVIAVLIDGIVTSQGLGMDAYSGISLVKPFTSVVLLVAGFLSTGCNLVSSRLIGSGRKEEANEAVNLSLLLSVVFSGLILILTLCFPNAIMTVCGVNMSKYPELNPHIYGYLRGYIIGVPALMLIQVLGPVLVVDNGKRLFTLSSVILCAVDIIGDLLNVYVFHGGAFGMGLATSAAYILQFLVLLIHFVRKSSYFKLSLKACRLRHIKELFRNGTPALVKKLSGALRDIVINYINVMVALTTAAIAARGIQNDIFALLFCIPTGLGRTLISMTGIYYSANDALGLKRILSYAVSFAARITGIAAVITFIIAPFIAKLYTKDPEVLSLASFSIRWMTVALVFDTPIVLLQHFFQGSDNLKRANVLSILERFVVPSLSALILGLLFGSKGVLASFAVGKIVLLLGIFVSNCIYNRGIPKDWYQIMFLPEGYGGAQSDNMYAEIRTVGDAAEISLQTHKFCREHKVDEAKSYYTTLCVEEMTKNVIEHAEKKGIRDVCLDFHLFISEGKITVCLTDLSEQFDPTLFYQQHLHDAPEDNIGIRMVIKMATDVRYYSTFRSNNLLISI